VNILLGTSGIKFDAEDGDTFNFNGELFSNVDLNYFDSNEDIIFNIDQSVPAVTIGALGGVADTTLFVNGTSKFQGGSQFMSHITSSGNISSSGTITATTFVGNIDAVDGDFDGTLEADAITIGGATLASVIEGTTVDNATAATTAITSTNAVHAYVADNESTDEENQITFVENAEGGGAYRGLEADGDLTYNPSLGRLSTTQVSATHVTASGNISSSITSTGSFGHLLVNDLSQPNLLLLSQSISTRVTTAEAADGDITSVQDGNGLTGGQNSGDVTLTVGQGAGITVNTNDVAVTAAQTAITSLLNTGMAQIGTADDQEYIDFSTSNEINFKIDDTERLSVTGTGVVVTGNLTVNGTTTTVDTTNTQLKDQFLLLASGSSATNVDAGIIVQSGSVPGTGSAFYHDQSDERWSVAKSISSVRTEATAPTQFVTTVKTDTVNPDTTSGSYGAGEMHVNTSTGEIWIRFG